MKKTLVAAVAAMAAGQAFAAIPVARWDIVPHQRISGVFNAGVVAFHEDGVKVTFDVGGRKFTAEEPKLNARTGVWEYFVPIVAAKLPDGLVAVKAVANGDGSAGLKVWRNAFYGKDRKGGDTGEYGSETARAERPFADEARHHYALRAGSPALKHGVPLQCVPADINGNPYPRGPRPCGAYAK